MKHTCHLKGCKAACPPRHLFCAPHWARVPPSTQREVYRTVKLRGPSVDASWAPWWRAVTEAEVSVLSQLYTDPRDIWEIARIEAKGAAFASTLEDRSAS